MSVEYNLYDLYLNKLEDVISLSDEVFTVALKICILHDVVCWQLANRRMRGKLKFKNISDVSGTTAKPHRQKGTGKARQGSLRSSQFVGGGVAFGSSIADYSMKINKKVVKFGIRMALSEKLRCNELFIIDDFNKYTVYDYRNSLNSIGKKVLLLGEISGDVRRFCANLVDVDILPVLAVNVYDILKNDLVILEKGVIQYLENRFK